MLALLDIIFSPLVIKTVLLFGFGVSVFLLAYLIFPNEEQLAAQKMLGMEEEKNVPTKTTLLKLLYFFYSAIASVLRAHYAPEKLKQWVEKQRPFYQEKLIVANLRTEISPEEFIAFKVCLAFIIPALFFLCMNVLGYAFNPLLIPLVIVGGFLFGDLWLKEIIAQRKKAILRALPYTLDLLTLSVEAGMDFIASIQRLTQRTKKNPMLEEFEQMLKEIRLGTVRSDALRNLSQRLQIEEVSSFTTLLIQADQLGSSIGDVLRAQSDQLRSSRFQNAESAGAKASQLILFPLVVCIFPAVFIVVLGPAILNMLSQGILK